MAPNLYEVFHSDVTTYYSTQATYPSSPLHLSTQSSLHVISALTCDIFTLAQRQTRTPLPICNWFHKQWLPPSPITGNNNGTPVSTQSSLHVISALTRDIFTLAQRQTRTPLPIFNWFNKQWLPPSPMKGNNNGTPPMYDMNLLLCFILLATFFTSRSNKTKRTRERTRTTRQQRRHYPLAKPPGTRTKHGKIPTAWNLIYDPEKDEILTWTDKRIRIYRRRSRRQFVYLKGKHENTFPRNAQPIKGYWQGSYLIVEHLDHWTNTPTATLDTRRTTQWQLATDTHNLTKAAMEINHHRHTPTSDRHTGNLRHPRASLRISKRHTNSATNTMDTTHSDKPKGNCPPRPATNTLTWHPRQHSKDNPRDSFTSRKWHPQARFTLQWTLQHLDAYLALAEVLCEWNIDPG
jgi:hypothetical protein